MLLALQDFFFFFFFFISVHGLLSKLDNNKSEPRVKKSSSFRWFSLVHKALGLSGCSQNNFSCKVTYIKEKIV